eukprot:m.716 g.716  ORF g.716 m.716 type:complete len:478 (+) comp625_c0_seq1:328-1761(+)
MDYSRKETTTEFFAMTTKGKTTTTTRADIDFWNSDSDVSEVEKDVKTLSFATSSSTSKKHQGEDGHSDHSSDEETKSNDNSTSKDAEGRDSLTSLYANAVDSFEDMGLPDNVLRGVYNHGFENPTPIQKIAIKPVMEGRDMVIQAQAGQGKTGAFVIGSLGHVDVSDQRCQVLVLSPTRELAEQTAEVTEALCQYTNIGIRSLIGGRSSREDSNALRSNPYQMIGGTIGRVLHMIGNGSLDTTNLKVLVLDEADVLLTNFNDSCREVMKYVPNNVQVLLVTATATPEMLRLSKQLLQNPINILMDDVELKLGTIKQYYIDVETDEDKYSAICDLFEMFTLTQTIIFLSRRRVAMDLYHRLTEDNFPTSMISGDMNQDERMAVMKEFREGKSRVLLATDIVARGIDVQQISMVVNHSLPQNDEDYIHRVGRSGRLNRKGVALNLLNRWDRDNMQRIKERYALQIEPLPQDITKLRRDL